MVHAMLLLRDRRSKGRRVRLTRLLRHTYSVRGYRPKPLICWPTLIITRSMTRATFLSSITDHAGYSASRDYEITRLQAMSSRAGLTVGPR